jgi:LytS/YehU family sensor histidine kinase
MTLVVEDDGMGAAPEQVTATEGSGLRLLEARLSSLHGDAGALSWWTAPGKGFRAILRWPAESIGYQADPAPPLAGGRRPGRGERDGR